ncbi:MAG: hypothetical protein SOZ59_16020 [Candidatus Limivivens sp.]|nr:hypothetical protein [Candidatus Limivivens sp.]
MKMSGTVLKKGIRLFVILACLVLGSLTVHAATVVGDNEWATLYSDGSLVVHRWDQDFPTTGKDGTTLPEAYERRFLKPVYFAGASFPQYLNQNVTCLVLENDEAIAATPLWYYLFWYPNIKEIHYRGNSGYVVGLSMFVFSPRTGYGWNCGFSLDSAYGQTAFQEWNSQFRNKMKADGDVCGISLSPEMTIYAKSGQGFEEAARYAGLKFVCEDCPLDKLLSVVANGSVFYDGKSHVSDITSGLHIRCANDHGTESYLSHKVLTLGKDFTIAYYNKTTGKKGDVTNAGSVQVTVTGKDGHSGTLTGYLIIQPQALQKSRITLSKTSYVYDGKAKKPKVTVKNAAGDTLKAGTDYTVSYSSNKNAGTAAVTVKGKGNYTGTIKKTFKIAKAGQSISLEVSKKEFRQKTLAKKSAVFSIGASAKTKLSYKSSKTKYITVTSKGKVTVKKGTPKGNYKITVTAAAGRNYKEATKTVKIAVK